MFKVYLQFSNRNELVGKFIHYIDLLVQKKLSALSSHFQKNTSQLLGVLALLMPGQDKEQILEIVIWRTPDKCVIWK